MTKILLVEDDLFIAELYLNTLVRHGYEVDLASTGKEAHDKIVNNNYELVILDIILPDMDGLSLLEKLKDEKKSVPPVIISSNVSNDNIIRKGMDLGAIGYVIKSNVIPQELILKIDNFFNTGTFS